MTRLPGWFLVHSRSAFTKKILFTARLLGLLVAPFLLLTTNGLVNADGLPPGLVLWNKLGSPTEVTNSAAGPNLAFFNPAIDCVDLNLCPVAYTAVPAFVPGKFGSALSIGPGDYDGGISRVHNVVLRNASNYINTEHGAVEAWFMQTASGVPYLYGDYRVFDGAYGFSPGIAFGTNDITANGHFVFEYQISFGGTPIDVTSLGNGETGYDISRYNGQWIHLAGVWDRSGIAGSRDTLRLYVNGVVVAAAQQNNWGTTVGPLVDIGGGNATEMAGKFAVDNLKLWNYAKTDYSDRFNEGTGGHTVYASDAFARNVSGGWGAAPVGGTYALRGTASDFSVNGTGNMRLAAVNDNRSAYLTKAVGQDVDGLFRVKTDKAAQGSNQEVFFIGRRVSNGNQYMGRVRFPQDGTVRLRGVKTVNNVVTDLNPEVRVVGLAHNANQWLWVRTQVIGTNPTTIRLRAWADGQPEPGAWQVTTTDGEATLQTAGGSGLQAFLSYGTTNAPVTFSFDDLTVGSVP